MKVFGEIRDKMNEFGAETNLQHEFRGFRIDINSLETKLLIREAEDIEFNLQIKDLQERIIKLEEQTN